MVCGEIMPTIVIPASGINLPVILQCIMNTSSRSFMKVIWRKDKDAQKHILRVKTDDFIIKVDKVKNSYKMVFTMKDGRGVSMKLTGEKFSQIVTAVAARLFR